MDSIRITREQIATLGKLAGSRVGLVEPDADDPAKGWPVQQEQDPEHGLVLRVRDIERDFYIAPDGKNPYTGEEY